MTISIDLRWRSIVLTYLYDIDLAVVASVMGVSTRSISRWNYLFRRRGNVIPNAEITRKTRWPSECIKFVKGFVEEHPCFYIEELQEALKSTFPALPNISTSTICRALKFDLGLTRKVLTKRARESVPAEIDAYYKKLAPFYRGPHQLVFLDETAKDGRDVLRRFAWSARNTPAIVRQPFDRGTLFIFFYFILFFANMLTNGTILKVIVCRF